MAVLIGSARSDENGKITGGKAGDQNGGKEVSTQNWYRHKNGWRVFRCKDPDKAAKMAEAMRNLCATNYVGYDQWQRNTLFDALKAVGWKLGLLKKNVETDCSALIRVCCAYAGITLPDFNTSTEAKVLLDSGEFVELKGTKYTEQDDFLAIGDVLVSFVKGHTVMALTDGKKHTQVTVATGPVVKKGSWNIRKGPGTGYDVVGVVHGGDRLVTVDDDGWQAVQWNGEVAYISKTAVGEG
jgi:hypothetical protein